MNLRMEVLLKLIKKHYSPYIILVVFLLMYFLLYMPYRAFTTSGGEQTIMIDLAFIYMNLPIFLVIVSLSCFVFYYKKIKLFWHYNSLILLIFIGVSFDQYLARKDKLRYSTHSIVVYDKENRIDYIRVYYRGTKKIRTEGYEINFLKDSTWIDYNKKGDIVRITEYDKGIIVKDSIIIKLDK